MNKSQFFGGIICLAIAGLLTVLNFTLSANSMMFMVGDTNMPFVPPIVLGIIGIVLVVLSVAKGEPGAEKKPKKEVVIDEEKAALNKRLETMAWGLFLIMLGGFLFVPDHIVSGGVWPIGVGLIMLGLNLARYYNGLKMSGFTTFLGLLSLLSGVLELLGVYKVDGALFLIILGAYLLLKPWFEKQKLFGKAEESK